MIIHESIYFEDIAFISPSLERERAKFHICVLQKAFSMISAFHVSVRVLFAFHIGDKLSTDMVATFAAENQDNSQITCCLIDDIKLLNKSNGIYLP